MMMTETRAVVERVPHSLPSIPTEKEERRNQDWGGQTAFQIPGPRRPQVAAPFDTTTAEHFVVVPWVRG